MCGHAACGRPTARPGLPKAPSNRVRVAAERIWCEDAAPDELLARHIRWYCAFLRCAAGCGESARAGNAAVVPSEETRIEEVGNFGRIYHTAAPHAPLNSRYRVLYPTQFFRAGSPLHRILAQERPDLVEICDKYQPELSRIGSCASVLLEGLDFKPVVIGQSCERMDDNFGTYVTSGWLGRAFSSFYMALAVLSVFSTTTSPNSSYTCRGVDTRVESSCGTARRVGAATWRGRGTLLSALRNKQARQMLLQQCGASGYCASVIRRAVGPGKKSAFARGGVPGARRSAGQELSHADRGRGHGLDELKRLARERGRGRVAFLGHVGDREALASLYANCDVFCPPESTRGRSGLRLWRRWPQDCRCRAEPGRCSFLRESGKRLAGGPHAGCLLRSHRFGGPARHSAARKAAGGSRHRRFLSLGERDGFLAPALPGSPRRR